jgi:hypothetical protein
MMLSVYLRQLGLLCFEVSRDLRLLPVFLGILKLVPGTLAELWREEKRLAA